MELTIYIEGIVNETAITKTKEMDRAKLKSLLASWFTQEEPRWFERDEIFHNTGILLDKTTKVIVKSNGKKIDSFKLANEPSLLNVVHSVGNGNENSITDTATVLAMENSKGVISFAKDINSYTRADLKFEVVRIGAIDIFATNPLQSNAQYYIITRVYGTEINLVECGEKSQNILTNLGTPFVHPTDKIFNLELTSRFKKSFNL